MERHEVIKGRIVRFVGPAGVASLTAGPAQHLLTDCVGQIVMGPSEDIWCYPDSPELDIVWVAFVDDIKPIRQVAAAWLEAI
jgi:hypothetical protein